jgi:hypothetical protein
LSNQIEQLTVRNEQLTNLLQSFKRRSYSPIQHIEAEVEAVDEEEEQEEDSKVVSE